MPQTRRLSLTSLILLAISIETQACSPVARQVLDQAEVYKSADAVLVGKVVAVTVGLPADYAPARPDLLAEKRRAAARQGITTIGQTITLTVERAYKGVAGQKVVALDAAERRINSCDVAYDWQVGDRVVVFASKEGHYLTLPPMFDDRRIYTHYEPAARYGTVKPDHPYAKAIADETERFQAIVQALPDQP